MQFEQQLENYANLLVVHGLNVQPGQIVNISTEVIHRELAFLIAKKAYARGAKWVNIDLAEPRLEKERVKASAEEDLKFVSRYIPIKYEELVDSCAANLKLIGPEFPDILSDTDPKKLNLMRVQYRKALKYFYEEGIGKSKVHWTVAAAATPAWGQKVFPHLNPEQACQELWKNIFKMCRADRADYLEAWKKHNETLHKRAKYLTDLQIKELHFIGPETDLIVELSPRALFKGGTDTGARGVDYEPNIPTEECFTTPDYRKTRGKVKVTRPFEINGIMIKDLHVEFKDGSISYFKASEGEETFREYINSDEGAKRLGEVALVGIDSPIYQTGLVFEEILFDENAACHIAVGSAYKFCIKDGDKLTDDECLLIGCNESTAHTDMMISSEEVDVIVSTYEGRKIKLIERGQWKI
ncbi:MAG: Aminopeptidase [Chlamydiales bacterium]|jgi:aminopeptidase|nr:Aminopeptidase [Chlamydiales bacterium]